MQGFLQFFILKTNPLNILKNSTTYLGLTKLIKQYPLLLPITLANGTYKELYILWPFFVFKYLSIKRIISKGEYLLGIGLSLTNVLFSSPDNRSDNFISFSIFGGIFLTDVS